jgi:queuine tRNA-ribosyltransferase
VTFQSHIDGSRHEMSPERSIEIQGLLGSDIQMQLDECVRAARQRDRDRARHGNVAALGRALQDRLRRPARRAMFGIVQGGDIPKLREVRRRASPDSISRVCGGGLAVGEPQEVMLDMLDVTCPLLPATSRAI